MPGFDLERYAQRIGWEGPLSADRGALGRLAAAHARAIPFENVAALLGEGVELDVDAVVRKLVDERRGGYCFEQNRLFAEALGALGVRVTGLAARVVWQRPAEAITPRNHMLLLLHLDDGPALADVGFGVVTLTGIVRLESDLEQPTAHEPFRALERDGEWWMQMERGGEWRSLYRFDLQPQLPVDYESANFFVANHPQSPFVNGFMAARAAADRRITLFNRDLAVHHRDGTVERHTLADRDQLRAAIEQDLLIRLPDPDRFFARLDAIAPAR